MHIRPIKSQKINENLYVIRTGISNFYLYTNGEDTVCFDTGYIPPLINAKLKHLGIDKNDVSNVFLTHSDFDHRGGLGVFKDASIYLSEDEKAMITFKKPRLLFVFNMPITYKYNLLKDEAIVNVGKIKVKAIKTPGHTLGSMSYLVDDKYLFTGDTLTVKKDKIEPFFFMQNMNTKAEKTSISRIKDIKDIKMICTGHSGYMTLN